MAVSAACDQGRAPAHGVCVPESRQSDAAVEKASRQVVSVK